MRTTAVRAARTSVPFAENVCTRTSAKSDVLPSTEFGYPEIFWMPNSLVRGAAPNTPAKERSLRMSEFIAFTMGGIFGVVLMCCLQINRLYARKDVENEKPKRTDPVSSE